MLRRMEPEEEEGLYVGLPRPEIAPRPNLNVSASGSTSLGRPRRKLSSDREDIYEVLSPSEFPVVSPEAPSVPPHHPPNFRTSWFHRIIEACWTLRLLLYKVQLLTMEKSVLNVYRVIQEL